MRKCPFQGNGTHYNRTRGTAGAIPNSPEEESLPNTDVHSSLSSKFQQYGYNVPLQTTDTTSLNSTQTSEYADAESGLFLDMPSLLPSHIQWSSSDHANIHL